MTEQMEDLRTWKRKLPNGQVRTPGQKEARTTGYLPRVYLPVRGSPKEERGQQRNI